ncbi:MAG: hypothetical protein CM15mL6_030 [uncultured marine virus]|nr:MAG: hypothetical protein CM15mL6_030 [uncultured marine virus]
MLNLSPKKLKAYEDEFVVNRKWMTGQVEHINLISQKKDKKKSLQKHPALQNYEKKRYHFRGEGSNVNLNDIKIFGEKPY